MHPGHSAQSATKCEPCRPPPTRCVPTRCCTTMSDGRALAVNPSICSANGVITADETPTSATIAAADGPTTVIAMPLMPLKQALAMEGLNLSGYRSTLAYTTLTGELGESLERTAVPGAFRTGPAQVLVAGRQTTLTEADSRFPH